MFTCPVCEAEELNEPPYATWPPPPDLHISPPYEEFLGSGTYEVCPNCGFEFGFDDNPGASASPMSFEEYRIEWERTGSPRFSSFTGPRHRSERWQP